MIIRLAVIDPEPDPNRGSDVLVYQVSENSRELRLLVDLLDSHKIEHVEIKVPRKPRKT